MIICVIWTLSNVLKIHPFLITKRPTQHILHKYIGFDEFNIDLTQVGLRIHCNDCDDLNKCEVVSSFKTTILGKPLQ
jgi:hypothetical protein